MRGICSAPRLSVSRARVAKVRGFCLAATSAAMAGRSCPTRHPRPDADTLLLESTYGDRVHPDSDDATRLERIVNETTARGGRVIIPAFAVGRAEEVLYWLKRLEDTGRLKPLPVYLDSPMAVAALNFYARHERELDPDVRAGTGEMGAYRPGVFSRSCRRESRAKSRPHTILPSSCPPAGWRPAVACYITSPPRCPTRATPFSLSVFRPREPVAERSSMARKASRYTG